MIDKDLQKKIDTSKNIIKLAAEMSREYYQKPLIITYSGGKDSDALLELAMECLNPEEFEVLNSHTTVDAPETVYYIRDKFKRLEEMGIKATIKYPHYNDGTFKSIWALIVERQIPPTRLARYCCKELKEASNPNRFVATGVRKAESVGRRGRDVFATRGKSKQDGKFYSFSHTKEVFEDDKARRKNDSVKNPNEVGVYDCVLITQAKQNKDLICNPIYEWTDRDVWDLIHEKGMKYNPLYDKGFERVGCIGCPLAGRKKQLWEFSLYPKYKANYIKAFDQMMEKRRASGKDDVTGKEGLHRWTDGESVFRWWINDDGIEGQMNIFDFIDKEEDQ